MISQKANQSNLRVYLEISEALSETEYHYVLDL